MKNVLGFCFPLVSIHVTLNKQKRQVISFFKTEALLCQVVGDFIQDLCRYY